MPETFSKAEVITGFARRRRSTTEQQYLEALPRDASHRALERLAPAHEEAAQRVSNLGLADKVCKTCRDPANPDAAVVPIAETAASHIAAPNYKIDGPAFERLQHARQQSLVVLKISIDYRYVW